VTWPHNSYAMLDAVNYLNYLHNFSAGIKAIICSYIDIQYIVRQKYKYYFHIYELYYIIMAFV